MSDKPVNGQEKMLSVIGNRFGVLGVAQIAVGAISGSDTLTYAGVHNVADVPIFHAREYAHAADIGHEHARANRLRRLAAALMLVVGVGLGVREVTVDENKSSSPEPVAEGLALVDVGLSGLALTSLLKSRHKGGAHKDALGHIISDVSGTALTIIGVFGANYDPSLDKVGAIGHSILLTGVAAHTLYRTRASQISDHPCPE